MTDTLTQDQIDEIKFKCENAIENEEVSQATWPLSEQDTSEVQTTLYANDILALIKEVEDLSKATSWNFNVDEAPKDGSFVAIDLSYHSDDKSKWIEWSQIAQYSAQKEAWVTCWRTYKDYEIRAWHPTIAPLTKEELKND